MPNIDPNLLAASLRRLDSQAGSDVAHALEAGHGIHAVLGVPVRRGGIPIGTLDVYRDHVHEWDESERAGLSRYSDVIETTLTAAMAAHRAGAMGGQLQYALDYRVMIERAIGYLMASHQVDATAAFDLLRRTARSNRRKVAELAEHLLTHGTLPPEQRR